MKRCHRKTSPFIVAILTIFMSTAYGQELENLMAYASPSATLNTSGNHANPLAESVVYTDANELLVSSYFTLAGKTVKPYMQVNNNSLSFDARQLSLEENTSIRFNNDNVELNSNGKLHRFPIQEIDQYMNTSKNCLLKSKISIECKPVKVGEEKIKEINVFLDHDQQISFIQIGDQEYYLKK